METLITSHPEIKLWLVAENIRSAYNIGAMFRTADGTGITGIILTGYSPTPENPKVAKTSLGAEKTVPWIFYKETERAVEDIKRHMELFILETVKNAKSLFEYTPKEYPIALCVGNEIEGIKHSTIIEANQCLYIPMNGSKQSLNVAEAASIALYEIYRKTL